MLSTNPFNSLEAQSNSMYCRFQHHPRPKCVNVQNNSPIDWPLGEYIHYQFRQMLLSSAFPCILGRSTIKNNAYRFGIYRNMESEPCIEGLCRDLYWFSQERASISHKFPAFIAMFESPMITSELHFESRLWNLLQQMNIRDAKHFSWDSETDSDPGNPNFSFSFGETSFFVVGIHSLSSRYSRRFPFPVCVFNPHQNFEQLRIGGKFERVQNIIRQKDIQLQGNINPSLADFGRDSEAKQYSGRKVEDNWECPFHSRNRAHL